MKTWKRLMDIFTSLIIISLLFIGCGGSSGGNNLQEPATDLSGTWNVQETKNGNCEGSTYPQYEAYTATAIQTGNSFSCTYTSDNEDHTINGTISGNAITWQETRIDENGTTSIDFSGTVSEDGNTINGTATWTWTNGSYICSGTTQNTATRVTQLSVDVTGTWKGTWQSQTYGLSGTFTAIIIQHDSNLSGSIEVPEIGMYDADLVGTATNETIVFGDIENQITFTGTLSGDSTASGTYIYSSLNDNGTWVGIKDVLQEPATDLSGTWNVQETKNGNCEGSTYPQYEAYTATAIQTGNSFSYTYTSDNETHTINGTISGNAITWQETRIDENGTTSIDFSGTVSEDGNTINGAATWTWTNGSDICSGTTQNTATRVTQLSVDVTGTWEGTWQSQTYGLSGTFTAIIIQHNSNLSGSIEVPEIGMYDADLVGNATNETIVFGDIENQITFTGTLSGDSTASGTYIYPSLYDNGTWVGIKEE